MPLGTTRGRAGRAAKVNSSLWFAERDARSAQQEKKFAGPEQNVQQAPTLQIGEVLALQANVQRFARAFLDERAHRRQCDRIFADFLPARIHTFQFAVATREKMIQTKSLLIQGSNRGAVASTLAAVSFPHVCIHLA